MSAPGWDGLRCPWCDSLNVVCRHTGVAHQGCSFVCGWCGYDGTPASGALGYVVVTAQPDGTWRDDWDGKVHTDRPAGASALAAAGEALGPDRVQLCRLMPVPALAEGAAG